MIVWAVVPAAGTGERMGGGMPKALRLIGGRPMVGYAVRALASSPSIAGVVVAGPDEVTVVARALSPAVIAAAGGDSRQASVRAALAVVPPAATHVVVHDAARPLVSVDLIERVVAALAGSDAVVAAIAVSDTIKRVSGDTIEETLDRAALRRAQTPQGFRLPVLRAAHDAAAEAGYEATDDAAIVERIGVKPVVVPGDEWNIKVTTAADLELAESVLRAGGVA